MKNKYLTNESHIPSQVKPWLQDKHSFIQRLKKHGVLQPQISVLKQQRACPSELERQVLGISPRQNAFIREVLIHSENKHWMVARTVIPQKTLTGAERQLQYLADRSLGSVIFKNPHLQRSEFDYFCLDEELWGRRSVFTIRHKLILLSEVFLRDILCL